MLGTIGAKRLMQFGDEDGGFTMYGTSMAAPAIVVTRPYDQQPKDGGNGDMVALVMDSRDKVDAFHAKAIEFGGNDEGAPGLRGDPSFGYYFGYFRDPTATNCRRSTSRRTVDGSPVPPSLAYALSGPRSRTIRTSPVPVISSGTQPATR